jgi:hypothetical protein
MNSGGTSLSEAATLATPTLNAFLEAGKKNDVTAGLLTFRGNARDEAALKTLFSSRRDVFAAATPLKAEDASYTSISGGGFWIFTAGWTFEAKVPNVKGVSVRYDVVNEGGWQLTKLEFFPTPN